MLLDFSRPRPRQRWLSSFSLDDDVNASHHRLGLSPVDHVDSAIDSLDSRCLRLPQQTH